MMVQSVAGLAAKAVNEGRGDEMVWVDSGNPDVEDWLARLLSAHPALERSGAFGPWELVDRYSKQGIIKGYILYRLDRSQGEINAYRPCMDCSVNVATSLAGLLNGMPRSPGAWNASNPVSASSARKKWSGASA
jgi:hypothetical protein